MESEYENACLEVRAVCSAAVTRFTGILSGGLRFIEARKSMDFFVSIAVKSKVALLCKYQKLCETPGRL
jgi:hypothetical protein